jgi:hypothetical protein
MVYGLRMRKNRQIHPKVMMTAVIWDLLLILQIEIVRQAVMKAYSIQDNSPILNIHVTLAILTVLGYALTIYWGRKVFFAGAQGHKVLPIHRYVGITTFVLRILTFITSFFVL